jgi:RNA polymerase sigma-70 factor (ECF subfamily)
MLVEASLIKRAQSGDASAFNEIVRAYRKRILGTIFRLISRPEDVEDVAQDVFVRLYFSLDQLRAPEVFEPWLYRLTVNAAYDYLRKRRRSADVRMADLSEEQLSLADAAAGAKESAKQEDQKQLRETLDVLMDQVSEDDRILLGLKELQGLSLRALSEVYSVSENVLKVRLFRARKRVLKAYDRLKKRNEI